MLRARSSLTTLTQIVHAAAGRLGSGANGVLLDENGLLIANTLDDSWLMRPTVRFGAAVEATLLKGSVWGANGITPPALGDSELGERRGVPSAGGALDPDRLDICLGAAVFDLQVAPRGLLRLAVIAALVGIGVAFAFSSPGICRHTCAAFLPRRCSKGVFHRRDGRYRPALHEGLVEPAAAPKVARLPKRINNRSILSRKRSMHGIQAFAKNVWIVDGPDVRDMGVMFTARMIVVKLSDGAVWVNSPVSVPFDTLTHISALAPVRYLVAATPRHVWPLDATPP